MSEDLYVVRLWDGMDVEWMDVSIPLPLERATAIWNKQTNNGQHSTTYGDIDYYPNR